MSKEEDFFKENFPEYVTEKGECLSPYWDLFSAGVICATFELNNEIAELKDKLKNLASVAEVRLANWQKYTKEREATLIKNWDNDVSILEEEKRLNDLWAV